MGGHNRGARGTWVENARISVKLLPLDCSTIQTLSHFLFLRCTCNSFLHSIVTVKIIYLFVAAFTHLNMPEFRTHGRCGVLAEPSVTEEVPSSVETPPALLLSHARVTSYQNLGYGLRPLIERSYVASHTTLLSRTT